MNLRKFFFASLLFNLFLMAMVAALVIKLAYHAEILKIPVHKKSGIVRMPDRQLEWKKPFRPALPPGFHWRQIESTDYKTYISNLRAIGCPEETIRELISAEVEKLYHRRLAEVPVPRSFQLKYWQAHPVDFDEEMKKDGFKYQQLMEALEKEKQILLKDLLGIDSGQTASFPFMEELEMEMEYLPEEKRRKVSDLQAQFQEREQKIYESSNGELLPEDEETLRKLKEEQEAELAKILTPEEMKEYELRTSETSNNLRSQLGAFEPSEEEFRLIFEQQRKIDREFGLIGEEEDSAGEKGREQARGKMEEQLRQQLGEKRFAEYKRSLDPDFSQELRLIKEFKLPTETTVQAYDVRKTADQQLQKVMSNPNLTEEQRSAAQVAIEAEKEKEMAKVMGREGYETYLRVHDPGFQELARLTQRYSLPSEAAAKVYQLKNSVIAEADRIHSQTGTSLAEKEHQLKKLEAQTERLAGETLGEKAFNAYKKRGGSWLKEMTTPSLSNESYRLRLESADF